MSAHTHGSSGSTQNIVGVHYRVGKKIGEGSFGVIFEGLSPLSPTSTPRVLPDLAPYPRRQPAQLSKRGHQVCERRSFVAAAQPIHSTLTIRQLYRSPERQKRLNFATSVGRIAYWLVVVRLAFVGFAPVAQSGIILITDPLYPNTSRYSSDIPFRTRGSAQHSGD